MASMWPPKKNTAFTLSFTLYKNDGTIVANPGTYTKKVSIDGGAVADITAAVTEEDVTYGQLSLVLAAGEMNGDWIWVYITDDTAGTVPFTCTLYTTANTQDEIGANVAAILVDTGTTLDGRIPAALVGGKMDAHVADIAAGAITAAAVATDAIDADALAADAVNEIADQVWDELLSGHHIKRSAAAYLKLVGGEADITLHSGTAQAGGANTITLDAGASATDDLYTGNLVVLVGGTGIGQTRTIIDYDGTTKVATVDRDWATNPDGTTTFEVRASATGVFSHTGTAQAGGAASITLAADASATDDIYNGSTVVILSGTGEGQSRSISDYVGSTKVATVSSAWSTNPDSTSAYAVVPSGATSGDTVVNAPSASQVAAAVWDRERSLHTTAGSFGEGVASVQGSVASVAADGITAASIATDAIDADSLKADAVTEIQSGLSTFDPTADTVAHVTLVDTTTTNTDMVSAAPTAAAVADQVWDEALSGHLSAGSTGAALNSTAGSLGTGAITHTHTVYESSGVPCDGALVWITTDLAGSNTIASGYTIASGAVVFYLDAGTYYAWQSKSGVNFTNPTTITVA